MKSQRAVRWLHGIAVLWALVSLASPSPAAEQVLFGPSQYTRTAGPPNQFLETIPLPPTLTAPFRLHIENGNADGTHRISSATITLNGIQVVGPSDFSQQVAAFDRTVSLQASNTLQIRLMSKPGSFLTLTLYGTIPPPTMTKLEPPTLPITQGSTGSLTATISAMQTTDTVVSLQSSHPPVATVPGTVTALAGQLTVPVLVAAESPGTATITATLNGSSVASTVTVAPAGPTLTSLLPATLHVTQGAAGILTVTLSAAQATETVVPLTSSNTSLVSLPPAGSVTVPAGQTSQAFAVFGVGQGQATITASLNGTTAESQVTVVHPLPTVVSLLPPILPLTEGSTGTLTVTLNASQPTDTGVFLSTSDATIVGLLGDRVTVPANTLAVAFPVTGLSRGTTTVTASLDGSAATSAITVEPPPPTIQRLTCPATLTQGATALCTVTLNATQLTETVIALSLSDAGVLSIPGSVPVPANTLMAQFAVTGLAVGTTTVTAGPLNGTSLSAALQVLPPPPTLVGFSPSSATLFVGATASLTLTLNAAQLADAVIPLSSSPPGILSVPASVTVPAGSLVAAVPVTGLTPGTATVTAGPLNGTQAESSVTVNQLPPTVAGLDPSTLSLPKGKVGALTVTIAPTQSEATVVPLTSSDPSVEVPNSVTLPAGAATAAFPVLARAEGSATLTAGPLNGTSQTVTVTVTPAELVTLVLTPPAPTIAQGQTQPFTATGTYTDATSRDLTGSASWASSDPAVATITSPGGLASALALGTTTITATADGQTATAALTVTPPVLASIAISPQDPTKTVGRTLQFAATGTLTDGTTQDVTAAVTWTSSDPAVATIASPGGLATAVAPGTITITATHLEGFTASTLLTVTLLPPDPVTVAPPLNPTTFTPLSTATEFLYAGSDPVQTGVMPGAIEARRAAVLRGRLLSRDGSPLSGVTISVLQHPEYGTTLSRTDGMFDLAVNGGSQLIVRYEKVGYLPVQRPVTPPWQDYALLPDAILIPYDSRVTFINLDAPTPTQVARANPVTDGDGSRQATLLFTQGTTATLQLPDGSTQPLTTLSVRATEYTVGPSGPHAMPGPLPPTSAYTYAAEYTIDEALTARAKSVHFSKPVISYTENFLNFPVGGIVPVGYYDRDKAAWLPSNNGRVIKLLSVTGGLADLDVTGSGTPSNASTLAALGITDAERQALATLYALGQILWRVPVSHFSPWDCNWPFGPPADSTFPQQPQPKPQQPVDSPSEECGSIIDCQNQSLGEAVDMAGTPFRLYYRSDRVLGRGAIRTLQIPLSGPTLPASLKRIALEILVAGREFTQTFPALPNQSYAFTWDGRDVYGRRLYGGQFATVRIGYVYDGAYQQPAPFAQAFGLSGTALIVGSWTRQEITLWQEQRTAIDAGWDARASGLGGWTLDVHHSYDPAGKSIIHGNGERYSATNVGHVIETLIDHNEIYSRALALDGPGNLFFTYGHQIKKRSPDGAITVVAGTGTGGYSGDGGPATSAMLLWPTGMSVDGQGNLFVADGGNHRIRKVSPDGIITTVAGTGVAGYGYDGYPALMARLTNPDGVWVDGDGSLFISDQGNHRIRKVSPDGIIRTIAGTGGQGYSGDGGPATSAQLYSPGQVVVDKQGNLFIPDTYNNRIRKVTPDGIIRTVAGTGAWSFGGDGGPAASAHLARPGWVALDTQGNLLISDYANLRIRKVTPDGTITTVAGNGEFDPLGDGNPATRASLNLPGQVAVNPQGDLFIADAGNYRIRLVTAPLPGFSEQDLAIPSQDGSEIYGFDAFGRHLRTVHALTGALRYQFNYDSEGRLSSVEDGDGNVTRVERNGAGEPTAIVAPFGQRTELNLDPNGYLASITDPAGNTTQFSYSGDGLLATLTTPRLHEHRFTHDALGRLTRDENPAGGVTTLAQTESGAGVTTTLTTALNRVSTYLVETTATGATRRVDTARDGTRTELVLGNDASRRITAPDGTVTTLVQGPDARFGMQAPLPSSLTIATPGGLSSAVTTTRTATLTDPNNPLSLATQTDTIKLNGRTYTSAYDATLRQFTDRSPTGRQTVTLLDSQGRVVQKQVPGLEPMTFTYDIQGRLSTMSQGSGGAARTSTFTYNPEGFLEAITDPLSRMTRFTYDPAGRVLTQTLPDLRVIQTTYDANGNVASITPPSRPAHTFGYTPVDLEARYTPPDLGIGNVITTYTYNQDRQLTQVTRPDGQTLALDYEPTGGRLSTLTAPTGQTTYTYRPTSGQVSSIMSPGGVGLSYTYDGSLLTGTTWTGPVAGSVTRTYDTDFRVATESVNGSNTITLQYDPDSLLTGAGALALTRHPQHGLLTGTTLGGVSDSFDYSTFGELSTYQARYSGTPIWDAQYTRDVLGRITQKLETIGGTTTTTVYGYDQAGRLTDVTVDGTLTAHYEYDGNGNRLNVTRPGTGTVSGSYDAQDRLLTYGAVTYTHTATGDLQTATSGGETTTYTYDVFGNLRAVTLPNGSQIEYVIDGQNRRIGKRVNGLLSQSFLYGSQLRPVAELDGSGAIVSRFVYGTRINVPDYMMKGGAIYRLLTDPLGSVRLVVDTATGALVQRLDYDEFGQITLDTNPGFQPFGFAGGLYDPDTKLTRFGARDYDAFTGRWTTKDPIRFRAGDANLYGYVLNEPVNWVDPWGLTWTDWHEVTATIEGTTADGLKAMTPYGFRTDTDPFVALPSEGLEGRRVEIEVNGMRVEADAGDIGPWNGGHTRSGRSLNDPYWEENARPQAECGTDLRGRRTNRAGIDISATLARQLGLRGTTRVRWRGLP